MYRITSLLTLLFGVVCCMIATAHIILGTKAIIGGMPVNATLDSEDRFFGTLFLGFGVALIWASRDLDGRIQMFRALLIFFFAGGLARLLSMAVSGVPHPLFVGLTAVELALPAILWMGHRRAGQ